jgi:NAD-dependent dihydropyrimidine dehydrogenase PreA subunit
MSKNWYPVIDYVECAECGTCVDMCEHGVYDESKAPTPIVINIEGCIEGCHGCGNRCPNGAIQYVGDHSRWTPPNGVKKDNNSCCCCGGKC